MNTAAPPGAPVRGSAAIRIEIPPGRFLATSALAAAAVAAALVTLHLHYPQGPLAPAVIDAAGLVLFLITTMLLAGLAFLTVSRIPYAIALGFWIAWVVQAGSFGLTYSTIAGVSGAAGALALTQILERLTPLIGVLGIAVGMLVPRRIEPAGVFRVAGVASVVTLAPLVAVLVGWPVNAGLENLLSSARGLWLLEPSPALRTIHYGAVAGVLVAGLFIRAAWERIHPGGGWWILGALGVELAWQGLAAASTAAGDASWLYSRIAIAALSTWLASGLAGIYRQLWHAYVDLVERDRHALARLVELDRFKDDLLAKVSHELKTPAAELAGFAELLADHRELPDETVGDILRRIQNSGERLGDLAAKVLEASGQDGRIEPSSPVDLDRVVAAAIRLVANELTPDRVHLKLAGAPKVLARFDDLVSVVASLLQNVCRHAGPRASVFVTVLAAPAGRITLVVEDDGPGLPRDDTGSLFSKFGRLSRDPGTPGVGLGLYLARQQLESMGGSIQVGPKERPGAAFVIELPALELAV